MAANTVGKKMLTETTRENSGKHEVVYVYSLHFEATVNPPTLRGFALLMENLNDWTIELYI